MRGIHSVRTGLQFDGGNYRLRRLEQLPRHLHVRESSTAFSRARRAATPSASATRTSPTRTSRAGVYVQDDIRVRKNLTLSPGLRYEPQTHLSDVNNFGPRFGVTWSPGKTGTTTLRGSAGIFYDWLSTGTYEQTLRVDGFRQREINIINPSYPTTPIGGPAAADEPLPAGRRPRRCSASPATAPASIGRSPRGSASTPPTRTSSGDHLLRGLNLNPPIGGVRPDPTFSNVVEVVDDARSRQDNVNVGATINFNTATPGPTMLGGGAMIIMNGGAAPPAPSTARWNWRRMNVFTNVTFGAQPQQHRRRVQHAGHRLRPGRLGTLQPGRPPPLQPRVEQQPAAQLQRQPQRQHVQRAAVHHSHRLRRERRPGVQRPAARRRTQHAARQRSAERQRVLHLRVDASGSRSSDPAASTSARTAARSRCRRAPRRAPAGSGCR